MEYPIFVIGTNQFIWQAAPTLESGGALDE